MLHANNSYMHKQYMKFDTNEATKCINYYYNSLYVSQETLENLLMQFIGLPTKIIKMRSGTKEMLNFPWIFKSWNDAFAYFKSRHFQVKFKNQPAVEFLGDAISSFLINHSVIKEKVYKQMSKFNTTNIEELIMVNKPKEVVKSAPVQQDMLPKDAKRNIADVVLDESVTERPESKIVEAILKDKSNDQQLTSLSKPFDHGTALPLVKKFINESQEPEILTEESLGLLVQRLFDLSAPRSVQERRITDHAKEREFYGKDIREFMTAVANGFFTYSFKNIRHAEDNFNKLKSHAKKYLKEHPLVTSKPTVTQTDSKEEITMSAKQPTQAEIYQTITQGPVTIEAIRALVKQLFTDAVKRKPKDNVLDRFVQSIDVHEHWSGVVQWMLSDNYQPNLHKLPFGSDIKSDMIKLLKTLESDGTFDFSSIPAVNPMFDQPITADMNVVDTNVSENETNAIVLDNIRMEKLLRLVANVFSIFVDKTSSIVRKHVYNAFTPIEDFKILSTETGEELDWDSEEVSLNAPHLALQMLAVTFVTESGMGNDTAQLFAHYLDAIMTMKPSCIYTAHLSMFPNWKNITEEHNKSAYMIISSLLNPEEAERFLKQADNLTILIDQSLAPLEAQRLPTDTVDPLLYAVGIVQHVIKQFTKEEKEVKEEAAIPQLDQDNEPTAESVERPQQPIVDKNTIGQLIHIIGIPLNFEHHAVLTTIMCDIIGNIKSIKVSDLYMHRNILLRVATTIALVTGKIQHNSTTLLMLKRIYLLPVTLDLTSNTSIFDDLVEYAGDICHIDNCYLSLSNRIYTADQAAMCVDWALNKQTVSITELWQITFAPSNYGTDNLNMYSRPVRHSYFDAPFQSQPNMPVYGQPAANYIAQPIYPKMQPGFAPFQPQPSINPFLQSTYNPQPFINPNPTDVMAGQLLSTDELNNYAQGIGGGRRQDMFGSHIHSASNAVSEASDYLDPMRKIVDRQNWTNDKLDKIDAAVLELDMLDIQIEALNKERTRLKAKVRNLVRGIKLNK